MIKPITISLLALVALSADASQTIRLKGPKGFESIDGTRVVSAILKLHPEPMDQGKKPDKEIHLSGQKLQVLLSTIQFDSPKEPGAPLAIVTGELVLFIKSAEFRAITDRKFNLYNGRLLNDLEAPQVYYSMKKTISYSDYN